MRVLVACECSNTVRDAFLARGHDAYSCDVQRADHPNSNYRRHIRGDVRPLLQERWDLVIAHPPCTHLARSGAVAHTPGSYQYNPNKSELMLSGVLFFLQCYNANTDKVCVENPIMLGRAKDLIGIKPDQTIQPWQFGHPYTKATCLWLRGLPLLKPTKIISDEYVVPWVDYGNTSKGKRGIARNSKIRAKTFAGIAHAMSEQWG